jgi:hypothetical protein
MFFFRLKMNSQAHHKNVDKPKGDGAMSMTIGWNYSIPICRIKQKSQP